MMAASKKRQRPLDEDGDEASAELDGGVASKKVRKETNASARRSLFVRSLPATATSDGLTELFSQSYPLKHATVVVDPTTKQSKGYGFVTFADAEDAQRAVDEFNGQSFQGRKMRIEIAQPRSRESGGKGSLDGMKRSTISTEAAALKKAREQKLAESRKPPKLIIRNLPWSIKKPEQLADLFRQYGKVKHSTVPQIRGTQAGYGFVVMRGRKNAEKALAGANGAAIDGRTIAVDWAVDKDVWEGQKPVNGAQNNVRNTKQTEGEEQESQQTSGSENEEDDVKNFMHKFGDQLEDEETGDEDGLSGDGDVEEEGMVDDVDSIGEDDAEDVDEHDSDPEDRKKTFITDNSSTLFIRNLPFTVLDPQLKDHFSQFGPVRYARVVMDRTTDRPKGTGFVCFFKVEDANACFRSAPQHQPTGANAIKRGDPTAAKVKHSILEDEGADPSGMYTIDGRALQVARAVDRDLASKLTEEGSSTRHNRDKDKRKLYLLSEGTVASNTPLYAALAPSEVKMREESAMQRKKLIENNPALHMSLTRLSIRNMPRNINSQDLKALAREAVVGFATDVKAGIRVKLSKEEEARGGEEMREAEKRRKTKGKGIVKQAKIVFEGREGSKVAEDSGAGRSRGYGFVEYSSHRWALMGLRWLNGHALQNSTGKTQRLIVEFAIENAQVVARRKEREEKARQRSGEVTKAIEEGKMNAKKKELRKDTLMARTRKGTKGAKFQRANGKRDVQLPGKQTRSRPRNGSSVKPPQEQDKVARRGSIIQKKRMMRRNRKKGTA